MIYRLTERGKMAENKESPEGNIIAFMQGHKEDDYNPHRVAYELSMEPAKVTALMNSLVQAGYLIREEGEEQEGIEHGDTILISPL